MPQITKPNVIIIGYESFGAIYNLAPIIKKKGYNVIAVVNKGCAYDYSKICDSVIEVSRIFEPKKVCNEVFSAIKPSEIYAVVCKSDVLSFTFCELAKNCPKSKYVPIEPVLRSRVKGHLREIFKKDAQLSIPFDIIDYRKQPISSNLAVSFPCIVKPIGGAGSQMVRKCNSVDHLQKIISEIREHLKKTMPGIEEAEVSIDNKTYSIFNQVLLEEYLDGPEFTLDGFVYKGNVYIVLIQDMYETDNKVEFWDLSYIIPPIRINREEIKEMSDALERTLQTLQYDNAYFHAEMKYTKKGPRIVELNPRLSGGTIPKIFKMVSNIDAEEVFIDLSLGHPLSDDILKLASKEIQNNKYIGYYTFFAEHSGVVKAIHGLDEVLGLEFAKDCVIVSPVGKHVSPIIGKRYLAFAVFEAPIKEGIMESINKEKKMLRFEIEG